MTEPWHQNLRNLSQGSIQYRSMMKKLKIDWPLITEIAGIGLATYGIYLISMPVAFIALGTFLIYTVEKE